MRRYSRSNVRKSSTSCSTISVVVFVSLVLIGIWMLMSSSAVAVENTASIQQELATQVKNIVSGRFAKFFEDSSTDLADDGVKEIIRNNDSLESIVDEPSDNSDGFNERSKEGKKEMENADDDAQDNLIVNFSKRNTRGKKETEDVNDNGNFSKRKKEGKKETEDADDNRNFSRRKKGGKKETEDADNKTSSDNAGNRKKYVNDQDRDARDGEESTKKAPKSSGSWATQTVESENEVEIQKESISKQSFDHEWKLCNVTAGQDYVPCLDNWQVIKKLRSTSHYEHRERHCPEKPPTCLVSLPKGYKRSIEWPKSRDKIWFNNVPNTKLAEVKGHQNWVKAIGEHLVFPGGGTQFIHGALQYIDFIQDTVPEIAWGKTTRVILDVGCGVASFGGYLFDRNVLAMSLAPKDEHEAQVQFALERGIPAILAVMGTKRLPFPAAVFDVVHCARCRVPWHIEGGKLLLELNRLLRPGGYFIWSATPIYQNLPEDVEIWKAMKKLMKSMCWETVAIKKDEVDKVAIAIYRKPTSNECYDDRDTNNPPLCSEYDNANAAWNVKLKACIHRLPDKSSSRGYRWPEKWPKRVEKSPYWIKSQIGVYGKPAAEDFIADSKHWKNIVTTSYMHGLGFNLTSVRNIMDMRAVYGGLAAALKDLPLWVMNVVPVDSPDTLPIIYERGLFGMYHDWCESFNTYPRTYDLLHADRLFSTLKKRCNIVAVIAEVDRLLRPEGKLIVRDDVKTIGELESIARSLRWEIRLIYKKDGEGLICVRKTRWRPKKKETLWSAIM